MKGLAMRPKSRQSNTSPRGIDSFGLRVLAVVLVMLALALALALAVRKSRVPQVWS